MKSSQWFEIINLLGLGVDLATKIWTGASAIAKSKNHAEPLVQDVLEALKLDRAAVQKQIEENKLQIEEKRKRGRPKSIWKTDEES